MTDTTIIVPANQTMEIDAWVHAGDFSVGFDAKLEFIGGTGADAGVGVDLNNGSELDIYQTSGFHGTISANSGQELVDLDNSIGATSYKMAAGSDGKIDMLLLLKPNTSRFGPRTITAASIQLDPNTPAPTVLQSDDGLGDRNVYLSWGGAVPSNPGGPPILPMTHSV